MEAFFSFLKMPCFPRVQWSDSFKWVISEYMYAHVEEKMRYIIAACNFFSLLMRPQVITTLHGCQCTFICVRIKFLTSWHQLYKIIEQPIANHLIQVAMSVVEKVGGEGGGGGAGANEGGKKMLHFGANEVAMFQGA
jgi:hypothetical protein